MIEKYLKEYGSEHIKDMFWSVNYTALKDNYIVVYDDGGGNINFNNENPAYKHYYQIEVASSDWDKAKKKVYELYKLFYGFSNQNIEVAFKDDNSTTYEEYFLNSIYPQTPPIRVGVVDNLMIYTLNLESSINTVCIN